MPLGSDIPVDLFGLVPNLAAIAVELGTRIAMPIAIVLLLAELAVALVARAIPQVNVFFLGLPLKILLGVAATAAALPNLAAGATSVYRFLFASVNGVAGALP
jgi:flagellar biosynthesis protein FliR